MDYESITSSSKSGYESEQEVLSHRSSKPTSSDPIQRWLSRVLYLLYCLAEMIAIQVIAQYTLYKEAQNIISTDVFDSESQTDVCMNATEATNDSELSLEWQQAQDAATQSVMYSGMLGLFPNIIMVLVLGIWSDIAKKRVALMFCPTLGMALFALFLLLDLYVNMDNFALLYVGSLVYGVTGGNVTFVAATTAYISDTANLENRTKELSVFEICNALAVAFGTLLVGYWIQSSGYEGPFWFLLVIATIGCIICFFIREPQSYEAKIDNNVTIKTRLTDIFCFSWCNSELTIVLGSYFMALGIYMFVHAGQLRVTTLFLETSPLCFDNITIGWWLFFQGIIMTLGTFGLPFFCHRWLDDKWMTYIGLLSRAAGSFCLIFATTQAITFLAVPFMLFQMVPLPVLRSMVSKVVSDEQYGTVFALMQFVLSVFVFLGPLLMVYIFQMTSISFHSAVYVVSVAILILPLLFTSIGRHMEKKLSYHS